MMFKITNKNGAFVCYQKAPNAKLALEFARMYQHTAITPTQRG